MIKDTLILKDKQLYLYVYIVYSYVSIKPLADPTTNIFIIYILIFSCVCLYLMIYVLTYFKFL